MNTVCRFLVLLATTPLSASGYGGLESNSYTLETAPNAGFLAADR
jgi:hypothetical protein